MYVCKAETHTTNCYRTDYSSTSLILVSYPVLVCLHPSSVTCSFFDLRFTTLIYPISVTTNIFTVTSRTESMLCSVSLCSICWKWADKIQLKKLSMLCSVSLCTICKNERTKSNWANMNVVVSFVYYNPKKTWSKKQFWFES